MEEKGEIFQIAQAMRDSYRSMIPSAGSPDEVHKVEDISIPSRNAGRSIKARVYWPSAEVGEVVTLFAHGGWWVSGDLDTHDVLLRYLANNLNTVVVSVEYRLAPEHSAPAATNDVADAFNWLRGNFARGKKVFLVGDSAGGNIMAALSPMLNDGNNIPGVWLIYPVLDANFNPDSLKRLGADFLTLDVLNKIKEGYTGGVVDEQDPLVSPIFSDKKNLPPTLISVGEGDPLIDRCRDYHAGAPDTKLRTYKAQKHGFIQFFKNIEANPLGQQALDDGIAFLKALVR